MPQIILASQSEIRSQLLKNANVEFSTAKARVDEDTIKQSMIAQGFTPRDIADALAEIKAQKIGMKHLDAMVIGCDQILDFDGRILSKPETPKDALNQLWAMRGKRHVLWSAAVIFHEGKPIWRHVGQVRVYMRAVTDGFLKSYVYRNWQDIQHCVGAYQIEKEGARLFSKVEGDYFNVMGLPLLEILSFLAIRGDIDG
jgi:septum formation protein